MSIHALIAAAYVENLDAGRKWVLAAIADSADEFTLESAPGLPKLRAWSGLSESRAKSVVTELITDGYVERIAKGRIGRRAVYRVFPQGVPAIPHPSEVAARYVIQPVDNQGIEGATGGTADQRGCHETPPRVPPAVPLHASTSVSSARGASEPVDSRRPAPPASGFPGSRATVEEDRAVARRAHGANDVPCPFHAGMIVPCGRCAHDAADATTRKLAADEARRLIHANTHPAAAPDTEETTP